MLSICKSCAADSCVSFNDSKSKCVICTSRRKSSETEYLRGSQFTINGNVIEFVQSWPHLGHIITSNMGDASDIDRCRTKLISQINNVLCSLQQVDSIVEVNLLKSYCLNLYVVNSGTFTILLLRMCANRGSKVWGVYGAFHGTVALWLCRYWVILFRWSTQYVNGLCHSWRNAWTVDVMLLVTLQSSVYISDIRILYSVVMFLFALSIFLWMWMTWYQIKSNLFATQSRISMNMT